MNWGELWKKEEMPLAWSKWEWECEGCSRPKEGIREAWLFFHFQSLLTVCIVEHFKRCPLNPRLFQRTSISWWKWCQRTCKGDQWQGQRLQLQGDEDLSIQKSKNSGVTAKWQTWLSPLGHMVVAFSESWRILLNLSPCFCKVVVSRLQCEQ